MPIKNGIETTKEILQMNENVKVIFLSADKSVQKEALSIGVSNFLEKPFSLELLIKIIKDTLHLQNSTNNT